MIDIVIKKLFAESGLGEVDEPIVAVSGGFMHRMYKVHADGKYYAVKHLNPNIMIRKDALDNFDRAESLEKIIEKQGLPISPAIVLKGRKRQCVEGDYFYVFNWLNGSITDWYNITHQKCRKVGEILGRIHSIECDVKENTASLPSSINWDEYMKKAAGSGEDGRQQEIYDSLSDNLDLLKQVEKELNKARKCLPDICCISDEDMDPKNIMWENDEPTVIDLECLNYGNPVSHVFQLSLQWSGITTCNLDLGLQKAFLEGYLAQYDNGFREYDKIFGLAYTWVEWLEFNLDRALSKSVDEAEREMGITEVRNTINRIRYICDMEDGIKKNLKSVFKTLAAR